MSDDDVLPPSRSVPARPLLSRRGLLGAAVLGVAGAGGGGALLLRGDSASAAPVGPSSAPVLAAEAVRPRTGQTVTRSLRAAPGTVDLAGRRADTWLYDGVLPGRELRVTTGDLVEVRLQNDLPQETSIHWHGLALRNDMDGVPDMTQAPVPAGTAYEYSFVAPHPGTYFFHPHVGLQLDRGLYAPLVVEDPQERSSADVEAVLVLDDWLDGLDGTPEDVFATLAADGMDMDMGAGDGGSGAMPGMDMGGAPAPPPAGSPLGADTGDVSYPLHLVNGRPPEDPHVVTARPGQRVRLRIVNAAGDTPYRFAVGGHRLTVTHSDGFAVRPVEVDTLLIGMGERYDVVLTAGDGVFPVVAALEGSRPAGSAVAFALLRTASGSAPPATVRPRELDGRLLRYADLMPVEGTSLPERSVDRLVRVELGMRAPYRWTINGRTEDRARPVTVRTDERVTVRFENATGMWHPMHLHGHTFALRPPTGPGTRKDTVIVPPGTAVEVDVQTDNPGQWMLHCHNAYHLEAGMASTLSYVT